MKSDKTTFFHLFEKIIVERREAVLMAYYENNERQFVTGEEYIKLTGKYANVLGNRLKEQDCSCFVGMRCGNGFDYLAVFFALLYCGYSVVLLDENCDTRQLQNFAEQSGMNTIISDYPVESDRLNVLLKSELQQEVQNCEDSSYKLEKTPEKWSDQMAFVTSGTTGDAKIFTFEAKTILLQTQRLLKEWKEYDLRFNVTNSRTILQILPLRHCFGFDLAIGFLAFGYELIIPRSIGVLDLLRSIKENHVWFTSMVPAMLKGINQFIEMKSRQSADGLQLKQLLGPDFSTLICAGAKLNQEEVSQTCQRGWNLICGWGMTEVGIAAFGDVNSVDEYQGYSGDLLPWYRASLIKTDESENTGELSIEGDVLYSGMVKSGEVVPRTEGTFSTGDIFRMDEENRLFFVGRTKSVIIGQNGENVYPEEIEEAFAPILKSFPFFCVFEHDEMPALLIDTAGNPLNFDPEFLAAKIKEQNSRIKKEKRIAVVYIASGSDVITSKGELSRFKAEEYIERNSEQIVKIFLRKDMK